MSENDGWSLSARRAWIEIMDDFEPSITRKVALRKESVDRNVILPKQLNRPPPSLSARRAWIEMPEKLGLLLLTYRRSPQGERG